MANLDDQVADIRERVAGIEAKLGFLQRTMESLSAQAPKSGGAIVLPVALVITVLEIVKVVAERVV